MTKPNTMRYTYHIELMTVSVVLSGLVNGCCLNSEPEHRRIPNNEKSKNLELSN